MASNFLERFKSGWNAFREDEENPSTLGSWSDFSTATYGARPDRQTFVVGHDKSIIASIFTRISIDVASVSMRHVRVDDNGQYVSDMPSGLNNCLTSEANIDQAAFHFRQNVAMSLIKKGVAAIVPVDTTLNPNQTGGYEILSLRVAEIVTWMPRHVRVKLYDERDGRYKELTLPKRYVAIVENPLYEVMNEPNSTLQRLLQKLALLDKVDKEVSSGKLDMIIQLPYVIKSEARRAQAEQRRKDIEVQLQGSSYGIAYTDGTERITQLNRPAENNLSAQVDKLYEKLYSELGLTPAVFDGTADKATMVNYQNRTIKPILTVIAEAYRRTFLTKTAIAQKQSIEFYIDPFSLMSVEDMAEMADKLTRNEVLTSNEFRSAIGFRRSEDPKADELRNKNLPQPEVAPTPVEERTIEDYY